MKRPRAKTAKDVFADEHKEEINAALSERRSQGGASTRQNLPVFNLLKDDFFDALPDSERTAYEEKAAKHNSELRNEPPSVHVFEYVFYPVCIVFNLISTHFQKPEELGFYHNTNPPWIDWPQLGTEWRYCFLCYGWL